ncbi:S-adenosylmethionine-dependent methyltransferase [Halomicronema hongdechloris C2206]|uniref:S-adenosylmethionine-dependent methyltransferase n=1 Tax=Halomicronema hongdechloris C2206 TaxID=1641165 RepID=A0A1Z3HRE0_9CYAN|nr:class I SAM-dependent methyltransferase [Halomicronema hongdechloris]ASC72883.1 S-adenosylmethionine-dependent methyltransferase [Halomicronema hongdechloris C2206]
MSQIKKLNRYKQKVALGFDLAAADYESHSLRYLPDCANHLVKLAKMQSGQKILDVATGTGFAALAAAKSVGSTGNVIGIDIAKNMLEKSQENIEAMGFKNVEMHVGDAESLNFKNNEFDGVICASGIFFLSDVVAALQEWRRVTKEGGFVSFSSFDQIAFKPMLELLLTRLQKHCVSMTMPVPAKQIDSTEKCYDSLNSAGFEKIEIQTQQLGYYLNNVYEWWNIVWNSGFRFYVSQLPPENLELFKKEHLAEIETYTTKQGIWFDVETIFAKGFKETV